jgi:hypothetical protein
MLLKCLIKNSTIKKARINKLGQNLDVLKKTKKLLKIIAKYMNSHLIKTSTH